MNKHQGRRQKAKAHKYQTYKLQDRCFRNAVRRLEKHIKRSEGKDQVAITALASLKQTGERKK